MFVPPYNHRSRYGRTPLLTYLVGEAKADLDCVTNDGQTAFDFIQSSEGTRLLLTLGARPTHTLDKQYFPSILRQDPANMSVKMFVLGKSGTGKSTLSKSLRSERKGFFRFMSRYIKTRNVDKQTAGIIPYEVIQKTLGSVTIFDFAGDKLFYAGHDAVLCNSIANCPSIILVMVDLREEKNEFRETLVYWLEFVENRCTERGPRPHLFLIGSHADQVKDVEEKSQLMKSLVSSSKSYGFTYSGQVILDCRFAESPQMTELYTMLANSCHKLRSSQTLSFDSHSFLLFLLDKFKDRPALTLGTAMAKVREASRDEIYWTFLKSRNLLETCEQLNERGNILLMKNHNNPNNSWIILNKPVLLSHVLGTIFAPKGFKQHHRIATSMGIVPLSNLVNLFPNLKSDMLTNFLSHMGFCQEIDHQFLPCLQSHDISYSSSERYFMFPGLVELSTPGDLWQPDSDRKCCHSGWVLQCSGLGQVLSSRFVQILLLRLYTLASSNPSQETTFHIWKNGIAWKKDGVDTIVEVVDRKTVNFLQRCKLSKKLTMVHSRSTIIRKIFEVKEETCPKLCVHESIISTEELNDYPLNLSKVTSITIVEISQAVMKGESTVSSKDGDTLELEHLLQFEPYAHLGEQILQELFTTTDGETTEQFLHQIVDRAQCKDTMFKAIMNQFFSEQARGEHQYSCEGSDNQDLFETFQVWRLLGKTKLQDIRDLFDQFSIFAGRNMFEILPPKA